MASFDRGAQTSRFARMYARGLTRAARATKGDAEGLTVRERTQLSQKQFYIADLQASEPSPLVFLALGLRA